MTVHYGRLAAAILYTVCITGIAWWIIAVVYVAMKRLTGIQAVLERIADRMEKRKCFQGEVSHTVDETPPRTIPYCKTDY